MNSIYYFGDRQYQMLCEEDTTKDMLAFLKTPEGEVWLSELAGETLDKPLQDSSLNSEMSDEEKAILAKAIEDASILKQSVDSAIQIMNAPGNNVQ